MFVAGVGVASPLGLGWHASVDGWLRGASGLRPFSKDGLELAQAGVVPDFRPRKQLPDRKAVKLMSREAQLLVYAAVEACGGTDPAQRLGVDPERIGGFAAAGYEVTPLGEVLDMFAGSRDPLDPSRLSLDALFSTGRAAYNPLSPLKTLPNMALFHAALTLGLRGPHLALGSSPAAGLAALAGAVDALDDDTCDYAVVGGADAQVELFRLHYMEEAGVVGSRPAEGAAALLLGDAGDVEILAVQLGQEPPAGPMPGEAYSVVSDGGARREALYRRVVEQAGCAVDLVIADLWGLPQRDGFERRAVTTVMPEGPILATRPRLGHMGAAHGLFDVALAVALIQRGEAKCVLVTAGGSAGDLGAVVLRGVDR